MLAPIINENLEGTINTTWLGKYYLRHLYIVSDREIKVGDVVMNTTEGADHIWIATYDVKNYAGTTKKIEATTDPSLSLPLIPEQWIRDEWVAKEGKIDQVKIKVYEHSPFGPINNINAEVIVLPIWFRQNILNYTI